MSPTNAEHAFIEANLAARLLEFVQERGLGWVFVGEVGIYTRRDPDRVRGADIVFISKERLPKPTSGFLSLAPDLIVEVLSPFDRWQAVRQKLEEYLAIGTDRVWLVEPDIRSVLVYRSATEFERLSEEDVLAGEGALSGFRIRVRDLFV